MSIMIEDKHFEIVKKVLSKVVQNKEFAVFVYGSRVKHNAAKYSDLDLAISYGSEKFPLQDMTKLLFEFEESLLPYKVDIVDLNSISTSFKNAINDDLIRIF
ncbi:hypothetical protein AGMMS50212_03120 [Spirochaetia bacterium]|nr:hypothetical protein AGMMS50212_03120 [Spirochaetia bacterium]